MERHRISVAFVGVFENILPVIPMLDQDFCMNFFDNKNLTSFGFGPEGFIIRMNTIPVHSVLINPQKISIVADNYQNLYKYIQKIKNKLSEFKSHFKFTAIGLNYEYEWKDLNATSDKWIWSHFINPKVKVGSYNHSCNKLALKFDLSSIEYIYTEIEPRIGIENGLFAMVNHHKQTRLDGLPDKGILEGLFKESDKFLDTVFFPDLIEK